MMPDVTRCALQLIGEFEMSANNRIERAILVALVENLSVAGFKAAAVWTGEEYVGSEARRQPPEHMQTFMTTEQVCKVFDEYDMSTPTVHFTNQHSVEWGYRGVMVVPGNGEDFISDWHSGTVGDVRAFDAIVQTVADAAYEGALSLFIPPADIQDALQAAHDSDGRAPKHG